MACPPGIIKLTPSSATEIASVIDSEFAFLLIKYNITAGVYLSFLSVSTLYKFPISDLFPIMTGAKGSRETFFNSTFETKPVTV